MGGAGVKELLTWSELGKQGFTFHLNEMMSSAQKRGDGAAAFPRPRSAAALHINTLPFQTYQSERTRSSGACLFPTFLLSAALDAIIALLMQSRMGDACSPESQHAAAPPLLVVRVFWCSRAALIKRQLLVVSCSFLWLSVD